MYLTGKAQKVKPVSSRKNKTKHTLPQKTLSDSELTLRKSLL